MMKQYQYPAPDQWEELAQRPVTDHSSLEKPVRRILRKVKENGDRAVRKFTNEFDGVKLKKLRVSEHEITEAATLLPEELKAAIRLAKQNIEHFHETQREAINVTETMPGIRCWRQSLPIEKAGLYIPGGSAPLFSTVLMLAIPAKMAGCKEIILCTPPAKDGTVHPAILYAASLCGVTQLYKAGGVQAIGAMAYGTESIPRVFKIFGPGNQYVTLAKQIVQQEGIAIDMPAGPSEVLVIADASAHPAFVAADLLSQAEHGADSQVILLTPSAALAGEVEKEVAEQLNLLPRKAIAEKALANSKTILFNTMLEAVAFSNYYAPEHLILSCDDAESIAQQITAAGSVFIGHYSPESAGDYASGTNHTLPTNGYAAMYSGVSLDSFMKKITFQQLSPEGLQRISEAVMTMAAAEGLDAHKNAIAIRLNKQHGI
jgi:histidinol dehydrogenase